MTNHNHAWKEFKANEVSHSMAHYLVTLRDLHTERGYARVSDVARELDLGKGTVSVQMRQLKEKGFVTEDENRHLQLSEAGDAVARQVIYNRATIIQFLHKVLGINHKQAEVDACKIEHLLSPETGHQVLALVQFLLSDDPTAKTVLKMLKSSKKSLPEEEPALAALLPSGLEKMDRMERPEKPEKLNLEKPKDGDKR